MQGSWNNGQLAGTVFDPGTLPRAIRAMVDAGQDAGVDLGAAMRRDRLLDRQPGDLVPEPQREATRNRPADPRPKGLEPAHPQGSRIGARR